MVLDNVPGFICFGIDDDWTLPQDTDVKFTFELLSEALCLAEVEDFFKMEAEDVFASSL